MQQNSYLLSVALYPQSYTTDILNLKVTFYVEINSIQKSMHNPFLFSFDVISAKQ